LLWKWRTLTTLRQSDVAERARIQLPEGDNEEERIIARKKQELLRINVEAARFFYEQLNDKRIWRQESI